MKSKRFNSSYRPSCQGNTSQVIFRYSAKFFIISREYNLIPICNFAYEISPKFRVKLKE